ncbi:MAG: helix-turn-helix domain-containing protein [Deltaproteobacteria bacterium]|nr:helix-turn-helix domain-containing protein [Deltaproteobacteria bacterium]
MLRERRGLTQEELAKKAGTARRVIGKAETGENLPRVHTLDSLLHAMGSNRLELLTALDVVNDRPIHHPRPVVNSSQERRSRILETLDLSELNSSDQEVFLAALDNLRALFQQMRTGRKLARSGPKGVGPSRELSNPDLPD